MREASAYWNPGPMPAHFMALLLGAAFAALLLAVAAAGHLREKTLNNPPAKDGLTIAFSRPLGLKIFFGAFMAAMVFTAMAAAWKSWLWGAVFILLVGGGRLNAALNRARNPAEHGQVMRVTWLFAALWALAAWLAMLL